MLKKEELEKKVKKIDNLFEKYKKEIEEDLTLTELNIKDKSLNRAKTAIKWNERYVKFLKLEEELNIVLNDIYMEYYYKYRFGDVDEEYTGRDLERKIKSEPEYMKFEKYRVLVSSIKDFLKNNLKLIEQQVFDIKNYIEYLKLENLNVV